MDDYDYDDLEPDQAQQRIVELSKKNRHLNMLVEKERTKASAMSKEVEDLKQKMEEMQLDVEKEKEMLTADETMVKLRELEKKYKDSITKTQQARAEVQAMKLDVAKHRRCLQREVGDDVNIDELLENAEGGGWVGRAQRIQLLKQKLRSLKNSEKDDAKSSSIGSAASHSSGMARRIEAKHKEEIEKRSNEKMLENERLKGELERSVGENAELKKKFDRAAARARTLEKQMTETKSKMTLLLEKSDSDDAYIEELNKELQGIRKRIAVSGKSVPKSTAVRGSQGTKPARSGSGTKASDSRSSASGSTMRSTGAHTTAKAKGSSGTTAVGSMKRAASAKAVVVADDEGRVPVSFDELFEYNRSLTEEAEQLNRVLGEREGELSFWKQKYPEAANPELVRDAAVIRAQAIQVQVARTQSLCTFYVERIRALEGLYVAVAKKFLESRVPKNAADTPDDDYVAILQEELQNLRRNMQASLSSRDTELAMYIDLLEDQRKAFDNALRQLVTKSNGAISEEQLSAVLGKADGGSEASSTVRSPSGLRIRDAFASTASTSRPGNLLHSSRGSVSDAGEAARKAAGSGADGSIIRDEVVNELTKTNASLRRELTDLKNAYNSAMMQLQVSSRPGSTMSNALSTSLPRSQPTPTAPTPTPPAPATTATTSESPAAASKPPRPDAAPRKPPAASAMSGDIATLSAPKSQPSRKAEETPAVTGGGDVDDSEEDDSHVYREPRTAFTPAVEGACLLDDEGDDGNDSSSSAASMGRMEDGDPPDNTLEEDEPLAI